MGYIVCFVHIEEKMCGIWGSGARWDQNLNKSVGSKKFKLSTQIKLLRHGIARSVGRDYKALSFG